MLDRAFQSGRHFSIQAQAYLDIPGLANQRGIQRELETFASYRSADAGNSINNLGYFVYADVLNSDLQRIAQVMDKNYAAIDAVTAFMEKRKPVFKGK